MDKNEETLEFFSDEFTSAEFKERWGADAVDRFKKNLKDTRYHYSFDRQYLADILKEHKHYLRTGGKPSEPGDFVLPEKAWDPKTHFGSW